jgi:hypothetical protein
LKETLMKKTKPMLYLAGPFFTKAEWSFNETLCDVQQFWQSVRLYSLEAKKLLSMQHFTAGVYREQLEQSAIVCCNGTKEKILKKCCKAVQCSIAALLRRASREGRNVPVGLPPIPLRFAIKVAPKRPNAS